MHGLVLVIEDNVEMSRFLVDCLRNDYRVATAFDGPASVAPRRLSLVARGRGPSQFDPKIDLVRTVPEA